MQMKYILLFNLVLLILVSCNNNSQNGIIEEDLIEENEISTNNVVENAGVSFSKDIQPLLDHDCISCHDYLESSVSYKMLTTHNSTSVGSAQYINTDNPTESYFYLKLKEEPPCGTSMGGQWTNDEIQLVLKWIEEGALNN